MDRIRRGLLFSPLVMAAGAAFAAPDEPDGCKSFACFLAELWPAAKERGVSRDVFDKAFAKVAPDPAILGFTKAQPEYNRPVGAYIDSRVTAGMVASCRQQAARWNDTLAAVEQAFGIERAVLVSIWALESAFGAVKGDRDIVTSLATLAHARYRDDFFRNELLHALEILQAGDVPRRGFVGSWAGAMGQPQFLPSSFVKHAVDFSGDGRRDIWTSVPDVLASIANYMKNFGWRRGLPWGFEVAVPANWDYAKSRGSFADWRARGFARADGGEFPAGDDVYLMFPAGARGPAFLVTGNYVVIKRYNFSDPYALAVAHLADRMQGRGPWRGVWPPDDRPISRDARIALQRALAALGYQVGNFVGHIDFDQRDMIRDIQAAFGMVADGNPTGALVERIRKKAEGKI